MKTILGPIAAAILVSAAPATAQPAAPASVAAKPAPVDPASLALAHQILAIAYPADKRSQMYASIMDSIVEQTRKTVEGKVATGDKGLDAIIDRFMGRMYDQMKASMNTAIPDYFAAFERAYAREFSPGDLMAILAFAKTPSGQHFFARSPLILKDPDVQAASQRMQVEMLAKLPDLQRQLMRDVQAYVAKKTNEEKAAKPTPVS